MLVVNQFPENGYNSITYGESGNDPLTGQRRKELSIHNLISLYRLSV